MSKLPTQLEWRRFVAAIKTLGYTQLDSGRGAARDFYNPDRTPPLVTVHEPHRGDTLKQGTLSEYLRKFQLSRDEFMSLLAGVRETVDSDVEVCCICHEDIEPQQETVRHKDNGLLVHRECHIRLFGIA